MKLNFTAEFLRIGSISGMFYSVAGRKTDQVVIYGIGAPLPPDAGELSDAKVALTCGADVFVADYIGYGRSEGVFTPLNCVKTFSDIYDALKNGVEGRNNYESKTRYLKYKSIHCMGRSFGGIYVLLLPKINPAISNICSIFPVVDWKSLGKDKTHPEETVDGFLKAMTDDGYQYLYRGILKSEWKKHFHGDDDLNPIDNIGSLKNVRVFLGHGKQDFNIYYGNTEKFYKKLIEVFPKKTDQFKLKLYPFGHSSQTSNLAVKDYFKWINSRD